MVKDGIFEGYDKVLIFSDGGPKHFKMTGTMNFFAFIKMKSNIALSYHFFESNHGHSVCDGAAAHAKKGINEYQRDIATRN